MDLWDNFRKELLSWHRQIPLHMKLKRSNKTWVVAVPVQEQRIGISSKVDSGEEPPACNVEPSAYTPFVIAYKGRNTCAYEAKEYPEVTLLRIQSFYYPKDGSAIKNIRDETKKFYEDYWHKRSNVTKKLIIDVSDNGGGDAPISWYKLFFTEPFQEQYVSFKKIKELHDNEMRKALFYDDKGKHIFYEKIKADGTLDKLTEKDFLPPVPQFCATDEKDCRTEMYQPRDHGFKGQVKIISNQWCHSSCVGFVWNMKDVLKDRVKFIGHPDNADSTYGRVFINILLDKEAPNGFKISVTPRLSGERAEAKDGHLLSQTVSVARSTDHLGKLISGHPQKIDHWVPFRWDQSWSEWQKSALNIALEN